jgi:two-component system response regulator MtrA
MSRILLVEDNGELAAAVRYNLEIEGFDVTVAADGRDGIAQARAIDVDLLILDLMLPGAIDGFDVLESLRADGFSAPVLILSAKGEEGDKVRGFRLGADQYLTKPFGLLELLERVRRLTTRGAVPRRYGQAHETMRFGDVVVDLDARSVSRGGRRVRVTPRAFDLLVALLRREGKVASRIELLREVWGFERSVMTRTVDAHVAELRRKLEEDPANPASILTIWGIGYRLDRNGANPI